MKYLLALSAFALAACDSDNNNNNNQPAPAPEPSGILQIVHASADAPLVNLLFDNEPAGQGVDYKQATTYIPITAGTHSVQVDAIGALGAIVPGVIGPVDYDFAADTITQIVALGPLAVPLDFAIVEKPEAGPAAGNARLVVLHATDGTDITGDMMLPVDVYVDAYSEPNAPIGTSAPLTFSYKETLTPEPLEVPAGDYQIRVTLAGNAAAVAYDSGQVTLADGTDLTLAAVPNVDGGPAAVTLLAFGGTGAAEFLDVDTPTGLRIGHLSPDTDPVDVLVNGNLFLDDVPYPGITGIFALPEDTYTVSITDGTNPGVIWLPDTELTLEAGTVYTALATGFNASLAVDILSDDDPRPVNLYSKVRIIHAAPNPAAASVDIYLLDPALDGDLTGQTPIYTSVPFGANTGYAGVPAGDYEVVVTVAGTTDIAIRQVLPTIVDGGVYTAIARDPVPGSMEFGIEVLVDVLNEET